MTTPLQSLVACGTKLWLDSVDPDEVLRNRAFGATGATSNPIIVADLIKTGRFDALIRKGIESGMDDETLACLDLKTGRRKWKERAGRYGWGQVLLAEDTLIVQADTGEVVLVEATPEKFHELARYPMLEGKTWTNPALSGNRLLVRNDRWAACYELPLRSTK